jgi:hypothetical protein
MTCIELLDDCDPTIDKIIFMVKINLPLHKQLKNIYKQNLNASVKSIILGTQRFFFIRLLCEINESILSPYS